MLMSAAASLRPKGCQACQSATPIFPFTMAFQPIVDIHERRIDGYEALVRSPTGGGASEVLAQVTPENVYAFDQACRVKAIELAARLGMDVTLSINFLPNAVYEPRACIRATLDAAARTGFRPDRLTFEIVETENIADTGHLLRIISEYRRQGFKIALDDFGTGYSGLARLAELRPDIVKLDRAVVRDCDKDRTRLAIVASVVRLGVEIGIKVVVEGVERAGEVEALHSVGARFIQGFYFAKPTLEALVGNDALFPQTEAVAA
jgi:EAL domain-containing protein (putative c-di-GMP-specific phosphodiesterase class I)